MQQANTTDSDQAWVAGAVRLEAARQQAGLSYDDLAEKSGVPAATIYRWRTGIPWGAFPRACKVFRTLGLDPVPVFRRKQVTRGNS